MIESVSGIKYKLSCALIEDSDQPAHQRSLIRVYDGYSIWCKASDGKQRLDVRARKLVSVSFVGYRLIYVSKILRLSQG